MNNILYLLIAAWIVSSIAKAIERFFKKKRVLTVQEMANNLSLNKFTDGTPRSKERIEEALRNGEWQRVLKPQEEYVRRQMQSGEIKSTLPNLASKKRTRGKWF